MARRTKADAEATRQLILDAAETVFQEKGVSHTTLNDIATTAGVTRGAIYWHFENKIDLFNQMHERMHLPIQALAEQSASESEPDPLGRFRELLIVVLRDTVRNPHQRKVLDVLFLRCEYIAEMGELVERQSRYYLEAVGRTERTFRNAVARGQLPGGLDTRKASVALHAYIRGLLTHWLLVPDSFNLDQDAERLVDAFIDSLRYSQALHTA